MKKDSSKNQFQKLIDQFMAYKVFLFILLVAVVYGYVSWRVYVLNNTSATQSPLSSSQSVMVNSPHIDQATIDKIQQLQNNSVSVQALFNEARQNPFQE